MKVRVKTTKDEGFASNFNTSTVGEVVMHFTEGDADSMFIRELDVWIEPNGWKDMSTAFKDRDIITDNYNVRFFEPPTEEDRKRGYTLT